MDRLEKFIHDNRDLFDSSEPSKDHLRKFGQKLSSETAVRPLFAYSRVWMRVAAAAIILVTAGLITFDLLSGRFVGRSKDSLASLSYPAEIAEAVQYYDQASDKQISELDKIAQTCPKGSQLKAKAAKEIATFDDNRNELLEALKENPSNTKIQAALIRNQQMKETALSNLVLQGNLDNCNRK